MIQFGIYELNEPPEEGN